MLVVYNIFDFFDFMNVDILWEVVLLQFYFYYEFDLSLCVIDVGGVGIQYNFFRVKECIQFKCSEYWDMLVMVFQEGMDEI